jgi:predicted RNase H-like HicB family nuclease
MEYIYAAVFEPNDDGTYTITFPDLPGCISEGKSLEDALYMAERALSQRIQYLLDEGVDIPAPSIISDITTGGADFTNLIRASLHETRAIRRTVSIPKWLDDKASAAGLSLSRVLQDALARRLGTKG